MFKSVIAAATLSLAIFVFEPGSSQAGVNIDVGVGGGRISCRQGARIVANAGFRRVRALDCSGREYSYRGFRRSSMYEISVRSRSGRITNVNRIRRGGGGYGWDDYDDDYDDY